MRARQEPILEGHQTMSSFSHFRYSRRRIECRQILVNYFKRAPLPDLVAVHPCPVYTPKVPLLTEDQRGSRAELAVYLRPINPTILLPLFQFRRVSAFKSATMAPHMNAARHILIKTLPKVWDQANSHRSLVQQARRLENPSKELVVRNTHYSKNKPRWPL